MRSHATWRHPMVWGGRPRPPRGRSLSREASRDARLIISRPAPKTSKMPYATRVENRPSTIAQAASVGVGQGVGRSARRTALNRSNYVRANDRYSDPFAQLLTTRSRVAPTQISGLSWRLQQNPPSSQRNYAMDNWSRRTWESPNNWARAKQGGSIGSSRYEGIGPREDGTCAARLPSERREVEQTATRCSFGRWES